MKQTVQRPWTMAVVMLTVGSLHGQVTTPFNQINQPGDFVGWDNTVTNDPLMIRHEANQPIEWYTNAIRRITLLPDATYVVDPNLPAKTADGWMLLCPDVDAYYG